MKHKTLITLILAAAIAIGYRPLLAQSARTITLSEAVDLGIKNSSLLKNNKALIDEASAAVRESMNNRLPDLSVSGSYMYLPVQPTISMNSKSGGDTSGAGGTPAIKQAMYGMASASVPIYTGGRLKYAIESSRYLEQAARLDADDNREEVIFNIIDAYANLSKAKANLEIANENLAQSKQRSADFSNLEKNGLLARNDFLKAELQTSKAELVVLDAQTSLQLSNTNMTILLGIPRQTQIVTDSASLQRDMQLKPLEDYETLALQNRKDMTALGFRKKAAALGIKSAKAEYYPNVSLSAGYAAVDVPNFMTATNIVNVGVGVKYSLSSLWKTDAKIQRAKAVEQEVDANEGMLRDNVQMQVNKAYQQYLLSNKQIEVLAKAVDQAIENYKITKNKFDNSLATTTDLLDADVAQLRAKLDYNFAKTDAVVAYSKLQQVAGLLETK